MRTRWFGCVVSILALFFLCTPTAKVEASAWTEFMQWTQTSFFGPQIFGGRGGRTPSSVREVKFEKAARPAAPARTVNTSRTIPSQLQTVSSPSVRATTTRSTILNQLHDVSCVDSDGGMDATRKGSVRWSVAGKTMRFEDESVLGGVLEFSCDNSSIRGDFIPCENGAQDAECKDQPNCPEYQCARPRSGCEYVSRTDSRGCVNPCAETVCEDGDEDDQYEDDDSSCPEYQCARPRSGCEYVSRTDSRGCVNPCAEMICEEDPVEVCPQTVCRSLDSGCEYRPKIYSTSCVDECAEVVCEKSDVDLTPRIAFYPGRVNQHTENGVWKTDPDGRSGGHPSTRYPNDYGDRPVEYCQKFWPRTTEVSEYKMETITTWLNGGNSGSPATATRQSYECVEECPPLVSPYCTSGSSAVIKKGTEGCSFYECEEGIGAEKPDFVVENIQYSQNYRLASQVVHFDFCNRGAIYIPEFEYVDLKLNGRSVNIDSFTSHWKGFGAGKCQKVIIKNLKNYGITTSGEYLLELNIDPRNQVMETDENNSFKENILIELEEVCVDSDRGDRFDIKGFVTKGEDRKDDFCKTDTLLYEAICDSGKLIHWPYMCSGRCEDGVCVEKDIEVCPQYAPPGPDYCKNGEVVQTEGTDGCPHFECVEESKEIHISCSDQYSVYPGMSNMTDVTLDVTGGPIMLTSLVFDVELSNLQKRGGGVFTDADFVLLDADSNKQYVQGQSVEVISSSSNMARVAFKFRPYDKMLYSSRKYTVSFVAGSTEEVSSGAVSSVFIEFVSWSGEDDQEHREGLCSVQID